MSISRDDHVYMAKLAEQAERFDEMSTHMKAVAELKSELTVEERNLLSVAFKNVIGTRRQSWRIITGIEHKEEAKAHADNVKLIKEYRATIEKELDDTCADILAVLDKALLPAADSPESRVFYNKMKGDYHRYLAEFKNGAPRDAVAQLALEAYKLALAEATAQLPPTHPIRLGLALNFSVFQYEILNAPEDACTLAKAAFDEAISQLDTLTEEAYKDSTLIMQLLRDNLTLWSQSQEEESEEGN